MTSRVERELVEAARGGSIEQDGRLVVVAIQTAHVEVVHQRLDHVHVHANGVAMPTQDVVRAVRAANAFAPVVARLALDSIG